jgi:cell wall assembly regulator SMI1
VNVEIPPRVRAAAAQLGAGVPYALKVLSGQLADDPEMGRPSDLPGLLTVMVDGDLFEDCPALAVGYIREPDRIEVRYVNLAASAVPTVDAPDQSRRPDPAADTVTAREVTGAWHRITCWLQHNAPESRAALRDGASRATVAAVERDLGIRIPHELRVLWLLTAGDDGVDGGGCLPGNETLMSADAAAAFHRQQMDYQAHQDALNVRRPDYDRVTVWKAVWIPVVSHGAMDRTSGLYLDATTGYLGRWSRYNEAPGDELDTLTTYLEEAADMLEAPALAVRDRPGLVGGVLVWGSRIDPAEEEQWQPLNG